MENEEKTKSGKPVIILPKPLCTFSDHSRPSYSTRQVKEIIEGLGYAVKTLSDVSDEKELSND